MKISVFDVWQHLHLFASLISEMPSLEEVLEEVKNSWLIGKYVDCIYGTSKGGQRFAILITSVFFLIYPRTI